MNITEKEAFEISRIYDEILEERDRQNMKHPKPCKLFLDKRLSEKDMTAYSNSLKAENKISEKDGEENWIDTIVEEVFEAGAEKSWKERRKELIEAAATIVRCIQVNDKANPRR